MSLPSLPKENKKKTINKINNVSLPQIHELEENPKDYFEDLKLTGNLAEEYKRIKDSYRNLIYSFEESLQKDLRIIENEKGRKLSDFKFKSLEDFDKAAEAGILNLNDYNTNEINNLIRELTKLEEQAKKRDLEDYEFETVEEFQLFVDKGIIELSKYSTNEINKLLNSLEYRTLTLDEYDIEMYGNIQIETIKKRVENINNKKTYKKEPMKDPKGNLLPNLPEQKKNEIQDNKKYEEKDNANEIEDMFDENIFKRIFRKIFKRKKDP